MLCVMTYRINSAAAAVANLVAERGLLADLLSIAGAIAVVILAILIWSVGHYAGLSLPVWYWALGYLGMTAATYAQLAQRRERQESGEGNRSS
jgi:hypothetical protein